MEQHKLSEFQQKENNFSILYFLSIFNNKGLKNWLAAIVFVFSFIPGYSCTYTFSGIQTYPEGGDGGYFSVTISGGCSTWTASTSTSWITITAGSGSSGRSCYFTMTCNNTGSSRVGSITVGSQSFSITQTATIGLTSIVDFLNPAGDYVGGQICKGTSFYLDADYSQNGFGDAGDNFPSSYSWTSSPSGFTSASPYAKISPTVTTTYTLTINDGCGNLTSASRQVEVEPLPTATMSGTASICTGGSTNLSVAFSGTSEWSISYSNGTNSSIVNSLTSSPANISVNPTSTTTYTMLNVTDFLGVPDVNWGTGCSNSGTGSAVITVNPLPSASTGSPSTICRGGSATIGSSSVTGDTYSWASSPSGFTSTSANPSVSPTATTTYTLTETITATGCTKSNSVIVTVKPLPAANAGANQSICVNNFFAFPIGASSVTGDTYSWTSSPSGFTSSSSQPDVNPTITTTYTLTETATATGCTNTNSVVVTVNPLPAADAGSNTTICNGGSTTIGASSVTGDTYLWYSVPSAQFASGADNSYVSNPSVSPFTTTTYVLYETITATGCSNTNSVVVIVDNADISPSQSICTGSSVNIGSATASGSSYSWTSNPSGFTSTLANPSVSPTVTTTYSLSESFTSPTCTTTATVVITVNPLPAANAGSASTICSGSSATIGASSVSGDTYSWTSSPSGFTSTSANPSISPTTTTTYTLTETVTATGCTNTNSVVITVNPSPSANTGSNSSICNNGSSITIGASSVGGHTYSWTSSPSGFTSTVSNPTVSPTTTTTYTLTETITSTGCSKSNSVKITVNALPAANAGSASAICTGGSATIGASSTGGHTYSWTSTPSGFTSTVSNPSVSPTISHIYKYLILWLQR